eukprot:5690883-Karenia_brevis.AAC.1
MSGWLAKSAPDGPRTAQESPPHASKMAAKFVLEAVLGPLGATWSHLGAILGPRGLQEPKMLQKLK